MNQDKRVGIFVWVLIFLIIFFVAFFSFSNIKGYITGQYVYEGPDGKFTFYKNKIDENLTSHVLVVYRKEGIVETQHNIPLRYGPKDLEDIPVYEYIKDKFSPITTKATYLTLDPDLDANAVVASIEMVKVIGVAEYGVLKIPVIPAFTKPTESSNSTITCENATKEMKVIWLTLGDTTKVDYDSNCVIVQGKDSGELIRAADRFILTILGVMAP